MDRPTETDTEAATFGSFSFDRRIHEAVLSLGYAEPTPIQAEAIPVLLAGHDVIGGARTGSGKTAAFGLPLLDKVKDGGPVRALVLAPTRELALQVTEAFRGYAQKLPVKIVSVYGGASYDPQLRALRAGATVVVATPGRLMDLLDRKALTLADVEMLVLDEADEMLRMGFIDDVERVMSEVPDSCQVALFSATMPPPIERVAKKHLDNPVSVQVETNALSVDHIEQRGVKVPQRKKLEALVRVLLGEPRGATLVFARTRKGCAEVADELAQRGVAAEALHGDLNQSARERVLHRLRAGRLDVVIATDVAARGLDVDHLTHVINLDLPPDTESYVHRIGRTGRAGRKGVAISFVTPGERRRMRFLERDLKVVIQPMQVPDDETIETAQREAILTRLDGVMEHKDVRNARQWLATVVDEGERSMEEIAAAAVALLARQSGASLAGANLPPLQGDFDRRNDRRDEPQFERVTRNTGSGPRGPASGGGSDPNEVRLYVGTGSQWGAGPGDIVGALANEAGIPGERIGKITVLDRRSFVGLSQEDADNVLRMFPTVEIRGVHVRLAIAREDIPGMGKKRGGAWGRPNRLKGGKP